MTAPPEQPKVSVVMPIRNEAGFIERCIRSVLDNDYPPDRLEVLVVDGISDDGTREIVRRLADETGRVRLLDNPHRIVPHAMNLGIAEARGDIILRVDGHAEVAGDFIRHSVEELAAHPEAWCAGGPIETVNSTVVGRAVAAAMSSPVGVGNARFRLGDYEGYVDTLAWGAYWKWVFDRIGPFDEELVRNQDDELNHRLIQAGGKIWMSPRIRSRYFPRVSLRKLARQYYQYGFWRIRTMQKRGQPATLRQLAPLVFVLIWVALIAATLIWRPMGWGLLGFAAMYIAGLLLGAVDVLRRSGPAEALLAPVVFAILHFAYGAGELAGIWAFFIRRRGGRMNASGWDPSR